jgi:glycosyltransferase involved in cell wall biosynthesis
MPYRIAEVELSQPLPGLALTPDQDGFGLIARLRDRLIGFVLHPAPPGSTLNPLELQRIVDSRFAMMVLETTTEAMLAQRIRITPGVAPPSLTIAICTKDRAQRLHRLLTSIDAVRSKSRFRSVEVLVVDNAPVDDGTRLAAAAFDNVRYLVEHKTGLNFARDAALHAATGDLLAFLDDDVVVDRYWLDGLFVVWSDCPEAGGYSGLVLPFRLDTPAQIEFELAGGFGRGFRRTHHEASNLGNPLHPVGAGVVGAGCNMCFDRQLLLQLGGFDEALDTGAPLPGGGDLDIFYRVLRSGRSIVYEPRYAVYHEHRETLEQLRRQYWSWGLGFMAFVVKCRRTDRELAQRQAAMIRWWFVHQGLALAGALRKRQWRRARFVAAELRGGVQGLFGEYDRSIGRSRRIREGVARTARQKLASQPIDAGKGGPP